MDPVVSSTIHSNKQVTSTTDFPQKFLGYKTKPSSLHLSLAAPLHNLHITVHCSEYTVYFLINAP